MRLLVPLLAAGLALAGCLSPAAAPETVDPQVAAPPPVAAHAEVLALLEEIEAAVASGGSVALPAMLENDLRGLGTLADPVDVRVVLRPSVVFTNETWAEVDGARVAMPEIHAYEGEVEGAPDQPVRLTLTPEWARGIIRIGDDQHLVRIGLDGNVPKAPRASGGGDASSAWPRAEQPAFFDRDGVEPEDCLRLVPPYVEPMVELGHTQKDMLTARIVLDSDAQFHKKLGPHAFPLMVAFMNEVDGIYQHEVGIRFQIVGLHHNTDPAYYPDPADHTPLRELSEHWNERLDVERDVVHLFTGQDSRYAMANCIGGAGNAEVAYTFTPLNWAEDYVVFHEQAFAHELGHIFSAHHHYGNHVETHLASIMIQGYTPGTKPVFSTLSKSVIRGWAQEHLPER